MKWLQKAMYRRTLSEVVNTPSTDTLRKRTKIIVVDDEPDSFPTENLKAAGYTIDSWTSVDAPRLHRLETSEFDIILLDIKGIAPPDLTDDDGIGILRRVKAANPQQIVIAFSAHSYDLSKSEFWRMADETMSKPITLTTAKDTLDKVMRERINVSHHWTAIRALLKGAGLADKRIQSLERELAYALQHGQKPDVAKYEVDYLAGIKAAGSVIGLINSIIRLYATVGP